MSGGEVQIIYDEPPEELQRRFERGLRDGMKKAMEHWQREQAPKRFQQGARSRYGLTPRTAGYMKRKARVMGHQQDNVWTGSTYEWIRTRFANPSVRRSDGRLVGRLRVAAPRYFYAYRKGNQYDKAAELMNMRAEEIIALQGIIEQSLTEAVGDGKLRG